MAANLSRGHVITSDNGAADGKSYTYRKFA